ncbi:MAG: hypothetical protein ACTTKL_00445 [Treponema sp.]
MKSSLIFPQNRTKRLEKTRFFLHGGTGKAAFMQSREQATLDTQADWKNAACRMATQFPR